MRLVLLLWLLACVWFMLAACLWCVFMCARGLAVVLLVGSPRRMLLRCWLGVAVCWNEVNGYGVNGGGARLLLCGKTDFLVVDPEA